MFDQFLHDLTEPNHMVGHINYFLLIVSMLMRRMFWLRVFAIGSGSVEIVYRSVFVVDPVSVVWEALFVLVNVVQLVLIWYYEYHHRFDEEHKHFADNMPDTVDRSAIKRLLDLADLERYDPGTVLTTEGHAVTKLVYIADGIVKIEHGDRVVAICGPGDYIGELSFLSGNPASANTTVVKPCRALVFDQAKLTAAMASDAQLRRTLDSALNKNLAGKLSRSNNQRPAAERTA